MTSFKTQNLLNYFKDYWPLEEKTVKILEECLIVQKYKKNESILSAGDYCNHLNFVVKGVLKAFHTDKTGKQHNLQFASEENWLTDFSSLYNNTASKLTLKTLEPSTVLQIKKEDLFKLYDNSPLFDRNMRIVTENVFMEQQNRILQHISGTAYERYQYFLEKYPNLSNRISNIQIASYIGVTPEFLSNIRKKIVHQKPFS